MEFAYSTNEERYSETIEAEKHEDVYAEAICCFALVVGDTFYVGTTRQPRAEEFAPDAYYVYERMGEMAYENVGEVAGDWPSLSKDEEAALDEKLKQLIAEFFDEHDLQPMFYSVDDVRRVVVTEEMMKAVEAAAD